MTEASWPWPAGAATGIGSLPGSDIAEATRIILGEFPDLPHVPELPARGPGADMIGRGASLLVELPVELFAARWRLALRPGIDLRRARDLLEHDLDELTAQASEYPGTIKIQVLGPWTLAATVSLPYGGAILRDRSAVQDLIGSLAEGVGAHVAEVSARLPRARILLQLDEPALPTVLAGRVPTESGLGALPTVESSTAMTGLRDVIDAARVPVAVHCCAANLPVALIHEARASAVAVDLDRISDLDALGAALDAGLGLIAGAVPSTALPAGSGPTEAAAHAVAGRVQRLWRTLGLPVSRLPDQVVISPACGLVGLTADRARTAMSICREAARRLGDDGL